MTPLIIAGAEPLSHVGYRRPPAYWCCTVSPATRRRCGRSPTAMAAAGLPRRAAAAARPRHDRRRDARHRLGRLGGRGRGGLPTASPSAGRHDRRRRAEHGRVADAVDRPAASRDRPASSASTRRPSPQTDDVIEMVREMVERGQRGDAGHRWRHRRPRRRRVGLLGHAAAPAVVVPDRRAWRRWPSATASWTMPVAHHHVASGPRRRVRPTASISSRTFGGPVEHIWLDRSYHVATQDYDRDRIIDWSANFVKQVAG